MSRMTRTQILLKEAEHRFLTQEATRRGVSVSAYIRGLVEEKMLQAAPPGARLVEIVGLVEDSTGFAGADHDEVLYGPAVGDAH